MSAHLWKFWIRELLGWIKSTGASRKIFDTISDNAANAGYILGQ